MMLADAPFLDIRADDFSFGSAAYRDAIATSWFVRTPVGYAILRYADCTAMLKDNRLEQGSRVLLAMRGVTSGPLVDWWTQTMLNVSGTDHTRLRRISAKAFTPPMVERLRPFFRATAERLVDAFPATGEVDFIDAFCEPYPLEGICQMLGIPEELRLAFAGWASDLALIFSRDIAQPQVLARAETALAALYATADRVIADRRATPSDDLITLLMQAESEGEHLTHEELRSSIVGLIFAGNDTTRNQLALGAVGFAGMPEQWALLRERPELAPRAVDEMMRLTPTIKMAARLVSEDVEYHGVTFKKGTLLQLFLASANIDRQVFEGAPFDITAERESMHLTFSGGIHRCLGIWLAKAEMEEALKVLSSRFTSFERDGHAEWPAGLGIDGPTTLPLKFVS